MNKKNMLGFGLWELLLVLLLLGLLSVALLAPLPLSVARQQLGTQIRLLGQTIVFAQTEARRLGRPLWLCPVHLRVDGRINGCVRQLSESMWAQGLLVYADRPGLTAGGYDRAEAVRTMLIDERRHRLRVRIWREQPNGFMLLPLPTRQPQILYGAQGWGEAEPVWLQVQLAGQGDPGRCQTLLVPPSGPLQYCQTGTEGASELSKRAALCVCF